LQAVEAPKYISTVCIIEFDLEVPVVPKKTCAQPDRAKVQACYCIVGALGHALFALSLEVLLCNFNSRFAAMAR
jgi:hypothetical protein